MTAGPAPRRPVLPAVVLVATSMVAVGAAFLPWYAPDLAPPLTPDSVTGWSATLAAKVMVLGCVVSALSGLTLILDTRELIALDAGGAAAIAAAATLGAGCAVAAVAFRTVRIPEPAALLAREPGLYLALGMAGAALAAALVQLLVTSDGVRPGRSPRRPPRSGRRPRR